MGSEMCIRDSRGTSQECPDCEQLVKKNLATRWHNCSSCGSSMPRDIASAIVIKQRAVGRTVQEKRTACAEVSSSVKTEQESLWRRSSGDSGMNLLLSSQESMKQESPSILQRNWVDERQKTSKYLGDFKSTINLKYHRCYSIITVSYTHLTLPTKRIV